MSTKAMAVILLICAASALSVWGGTRLGTAKGMEQSRTMQVQLASAEGELGRLQADYGSLQQGNTMLRGQLAAAEVEVSRMQTEFGNLQKSNSALRAQVSLAETELARLQNEYGSLRQSNATLRTQMGESQAELGRVQSDNSQLRQTAADAQTRLTVANSELANLGMRYNALQGAKAFTVDDKLQVTLNTEAQMQTVAWVRGEVKNVSTVAVPKVYVLVFRYKADSTLDKADLPPTVLMNLAPGETGFFSFLSAGETCKISVVGNY